MAVDGGADGLLRASVNAAIGVSAASVATVRDSAAGGVAGVPAPELETDALVDVDVAVAEDAAGVAAAAGAERNGAGMGFTTSGST